MKHPVEILYRGVVYRRAKSYGAGKYYYNRKKGALHRNIWEDENGKRIPDGYHVHHIDGNPFNNSPYNLEAIKASDHYREHWERKEKKTKTCKRCGEKFETVIPERAKFCTNRCWQAYQYKNKTYHEKRKCSWCSKSFSVRKAEKTKTCSKSCATLSWRRK